MMVKTHLSLTHDPTLKGVPKGWTLPIRDVLIYRGAKFLCPLAGDDQPDARHGLRPGLPPRRRRREHRGGVGAVLEQSFGWYVLALLGKKCARAQPIRPSPSFLLRVFDV